MELFDNEAIKRQELKVVAVMEVLEKYVDHTILAEITSEVLEKVLDQDRVINVRDFMRVGGATLSAKPKYPADEQYRLYNQLIFEELKEYAYACGTAGIRELEKLCKEYIIAFEGMDAAADIVEQADALVDLEYVLYNAVNGTGLHIVWQRMHDHIHANNMQKYCTSDEEAFETCRLYRTGQHPLKPGETIRASYKQVGDFYVVFRESDHKILKSYRYSPPQSLKHILES